MVHPALLFSVTLFSMACVVEATPIRADWMGAYLNRSKVGFSFVAEGDPNFLPTDTFTGFDLIHDRMEDHERALCSISELAFKAFGTENLVKWKSVSLLEEDFSLAVFGFRLSSGGAITKIQGEREGDFVSLFFGTGGSPRKESLAVPDGPLFLAEALPLVFAKRLREGERVDGEYAVLEPHQLTVSTWRIEYLGRETLATAIGPVECHRIQQDAGGFFPIVWIDEAGTVWKEFAPLGEKVGYYSYRETEKQARDKTYLNPLVLAETEENPGGREPDLLYATSIDAGTRIAHPSQVRRMVVDLWNFEPEPTFPFSERQKNLGLETRDRYTEDFPLRLEITKIEGPVPKAPYASGFPLSETFGKYLADEIFIESKDPKIVKLAESVTADATTPWEKALALFDWIQDNVETEFRVTLPSALEVLESRKGDCGEQSALFAALARAAGVPTKICTGLVYQGGAFYYHAWNEVLVQVRPEFWAPIDPALREEIADATHIKFSEGGLPNQTYINALIGKLEARIGEIETHDPDRAIN